MIILLVLLFSVSVQAQTKCYVINESKIEFRSQPVQGATNEACPQGLESFQDITYSKTQITACLNEADCYSKITADYCFEMVNDVQVNHGRAIVAADFTEVYCTKPLFDSAKKTARLAQEATAQAERDQEALIDQALTRMNCGRRVIGLLLLRNEPKGLTTGQIKQMNTTYASIKGLLETGSLLSAKEEMQLVTPDGTITTDGDKTALIARIDKCLGL